MNYYNIIKNDIKHTLNLFKTYIPTSIKHNKLSQVNSF